MRCLRLSILSIVSLCSLTIASFGQNGNIAPRINGPVNEQSLVTLKGGVPAIAKTVSDLGEASPSAQLSHVRLVLSRTPEQQAALDKYDADLQDKSSPNYHKWLTPQQFGHLYGPADSDMAALVAWLESRGLKVEPLAPGRTTIAFSGTVRQIEDAFHTSMHSYEANGEQFLANTSGARIPAALAPVVSGVADLNTIKPKPEYIRGSMGTFDPAQHRMIQVPSPLDRHLKPQLTGGSGTSADTYSLYLVAGDAATIYNTPNSLNTSFTSGTSYKGTGVTIGYAGDAVILPATVASYRSRFIGDSTQPTITNVDGVTATGDIGEAYLDAEVAGALAPGAAIHFYTANNLFTAIDQAISDNAVDILNVSFGLCELGMTTDSNNANTIAWQQAATQGIAVTVSTGDNGSAGCDSNSTEQVATYGLMVNGLASTAWNIAVGGTDFYGLIPTGSSYTPTTFLSYVGATGSANFTTALKYIPESTWNDSIQVDGLLSANVPFLDTSSKTNISAGSGGPSNCSTNTDTATVVGNCTSGYPKPVWQRGAGVPADGARDIPDISLMSGAGGDYASWLVCTDDQGTVGGITVTADCTTQSDGHFYFFGFGGTSAAAPAFAGILAMVEESTGGRLGQAAKEIYDLYNGSHAATIFHDIKQGNISVPCQTGTTDCALNTVNNDFLTGYDTTTGYDLATGMGSIDASQLITYWGTGVGPGTSTVTVVPSATTISYITGLTVDVTVTGSGSLPTPTGTVVLTSNTFNSGTQTLVNGKFTFHISPGLLNTGNDTLTATYSGDVDYNTNTGTAAVTVTPPFTLSATNVTLTAGASTGNASTVTITPASGFTGHVTLTAAVTSSPSGAVNPPTLTITGSPVPITSAAPGTATITVATISNAAVRGRGIQSAGWFTAAGGTALTALLFFFLPFGSRRGRRLFSAMLVVLAIGFTAVGCGGGSKSKSTPTVTVTPAKTSIKASEALSVAISVSGGSSSPTGTVTLTSGSFTSSAASLSGGSATVSIPANTLAAGTATLSVAYSGDSNFNLASGTASVTVTTGTTAGAYTVTVTGTGDNAAKSTSTATFTLTVN